MDIPRGNPGPLLRGDRKEYVPMTPRGSLFPLAGLLLVFASCSAGPDSGAVKDPITARRLPETVQPDAARVVAGNNTFALDLYAKLRSEPGNIFFSPFSISTAFAMVYAGARGET